MEEVETSLGSRVESMLVVDTVETWRLEVPLLMALASKMACQQTSMKMLDVHCFVCNSKEGAQAIATLVEHSQVVTTHRIIIQGDIGREGWSAIRRAVKHLLESFGHKIMGAMKREDLK